MLTLDVQTQRIDLWNRPAVKNNHRTTDDDSDEDQWKHVSIQAHAARFNYRKLIRRAEFSRREHAREQHRHRHHQAEDARKKIDVVFDDDMRWNASINKVIEVLDHIDENEDQSKREESEKKSSEKLIDDVTIEQSHVMPRTD